MKGIDKERLLRSVNAQLELLEELRRSLQETSESEDGNVRYCTETIKKVEMGVRHMHAHSRDFGEFRDVAVCSMITRI
jgi:hypothetical protein